MTKATPAGTPAGSLEDLSNVLAKLDVNDDQAHHEEGSIATFFKKLLSLGSKGEDINSMGAAAPVTMLEPLSQLEMVSRWNVETFLNITNDKTDLERMKAVVAFALACLPILCHDGKKPINPIITEVMTCAYVQDSADAKWSETAPVQFIGEQVSHHPPIPAFRLYSKDNQVALDQVLDFKFSLGSNGLNFLLKDSGYTTITLLAKGEVYVLEPAPIMIQPRASFIVNGGADLLHTGVYKISCEKTGMVAEIHLAKKKLFRSQGTSIEGFIAKKGDQSTPLIQIGGDWKDEMYFTNGEGNKQVIASASKCPRLHGFKQVFPDTEDMEPSHTVRLWNSVTTKMRNGEYKVAAKMKLKLENWQRAYFKKIGHENHVPKYFKHSESNKYSWNPNPELEKIYGPALKV